MTKYIMIYLIIALAIITRFIPHMPNVAPITALAIFGAAYLPKKQAIAIPLAVRFVSDLFLGFFQWPLMLAVYASHLVGILFGLWIRKSSVAIPTEEEGSINKQISRQARNGASFWIKIIGSSLMASVVFFLVTNFAFLYATYPHNFSGILAAYANGLPFFRGTLIGDLGYTIALFGSYEFARYLMKQRSKKGQLQNLA